MEPHIDARVIGMEPSATVAINERSDALSRSGRRIVKLGLGQSPFPVPDPVVRALEQNAREKAYLPVKGLPALREAVAAYHQRTTGVVYDPAHLVVGPGSKELMFILQLVFDGQLLLPTPAWVSYSPQAQIAGRRIVPLPGDRANAWRISAEQLEAACERDPRVPRLIILNYPNNPTGATYSVGQLEELARIARKYEVIVLSDEIYGELDFAGTHRSIAAFYPEGTIISSGLSKWCGAGGWRLGTFAIPAALAWLADAMSAVASETYTTTSAPIQYAAVTAFRRDADIERYLVRARRLLKALVDRIVARLDRAGARTARPAGAFYVFPDFGEHRKRLAARGIDTSGALARWLLDETGVATLPGSCFGRDPSELTLRLALVDFDGTRLMSEVERGAEIDDALLSAHAGGMLRGINELCAAIERLS